MKKLQIAVVMPTGQVRDTFIPPIAAEKLASLGELTWNPRDRQYTNEELADAIKNADVCVTGWGCPQLTYDVIKNARNLRLVAHTGGSVATLVSKELYEKGIKIISGNKIYAESVAEGVIAYILTAFRKLPKFINDTVTKGWATEGASYTEALLYQPVGLVGFGAVAKYLVPMLKAFHCQIYVYDPHLPDSVFEEYGVARVSSLDTLFPMVKVLSLHMPLNKNTYQMIDGRLLKLIRDGSLFVNTARGACIDEAALAAELAKGRFMAILDVYEREPLPMDSGLRGLDNVILIPHMAGPTVDRRTDVTLQLADDVVRCFTGEQMIHEIGYEYAVTMTNEANYK